MQSAKFKAIKCTISRGGFSDERVFTFSFNGDVYKGAASRFHMWNAEGVQLQDGEPPLGETIQGFVAAKIIQVEDDPKFVLVSIPDGEVIRVALSELSERPKAGANVLVGS